MYIGLYKTPNKALSLSLSLLYSALCLKCLKWHCSTVGSMKNVAALTEDGAFALLFRPHPGGFDSSRVPGGQPGGGMGAGGIDWCII